MDRLGDLLDPALRRMGVRGRVRELQLQAALDQLLGEALAPLCRAIELKRSTLVIATAHSAMAHQLQIDSPRLIHELNERLGGSQIERLRFTAMEDRP